MSLRFLSLLIICPLAIGVPQRVEAQRSLSAEQHYKNGTKLYRAGKFLRAAKQYTLAYDKAGAAPLAYNAARAYDKADDWQQAQTYYNHWLAAAPSPKARAKLAKALAKEAQVASDSGRTQLAVQRLTLALRVRVTPDPAITFRLATLHEQAERSDIARELYRQALAEGHPDQQAVTAALQRIRRAVSVGKLILLGEGEGLEVRVNGQLREGTRAGQEFSVAAGSHRLSVTAPGYEEWQARVDVKGGALTTVAFRLVKDSERGRSTAVARGSRRGAARAKRPSGASKRGGIAGLPGPIPLAAIGVGGASLIASAFLGSLAGDAETNRDACRQDLDCASPENYDSAAKVYAERAEKRMLQSNIALGVGIGGLAAGVALWLLGAPKAEELEEDLDLAFQIGPDRLEVMTQWRF